MTITLNEELERDICQRAEQLGVSADELIRRAVSRFLDVDPQLKAEMEEWQRMTWDAWAKVEESLK